MGLGKKLKKAAKRVTSAVKTVVAAPVNVIKAVADGDLSQATKEATKGLAGFSNVASGQALFGGDLVDNALRSKTVNALTFNTGREISNVSRGLDDLQTKGETKGRFYQDAALLFTKAVGVGAAGGAKAFTKSNFVAAQGIKSGVQNKSIAQVVGAAGGLDSSGIVSGVAGFIPERRPSTSSSSIGSEYYGDSDADSQNSSGIGTLIVFGTVASLGYFLYKGKI